MRDFPRRLECPNVKELGESEVDRCVRWGLSTGDVAGLCESKWRKHSSVHVSEERVSSRSNGHTSTAGLVDSLPESLSLDSLMSLR